MTPNLDYAKLVRGKLLGESMREVGVLVLVFVPLDVMLEWKSTKVLHYASGLNGWLDWLTPQLLSLIFFTLAAIVMLYLGIKLETKATVELEAVKGDNHNGDSGDSDV